MTVSYYYIHIENTFVKYFGRYGNKPYETLEIKYYYISNIDNLLNFLQLYFLEGSGKKHNIENELLKIIENIIQNKDIIENDKTSQILFELRNKDPELIHHDYGFIEVRKIVKNIEFNL